MNETQKYIRAYQKALPRLKEKVISALLMLVISAVMATSASFAWISLSVNPEISGIETTVAANGNLEIALSDKAGTEPVKSEVGDSGKNLVLKNITWGNIVNLSDPSYGLEELDLRPAELNLSGNLLTTPLKVVTYGSDGRVEKFSSSLKYANWDTQNKTYVVPGIPEYGVRAISTVTYKNLTGNTEYMDMVTELDTNLSAATAIYFDMINDDAVINALKGLIGAFVDNKLNGGSPDVTEYVPALYDMMLRFTNFVEATGSIMCDIAHMQQYPHFGKDDRKYYTIDTLLAAPASELENQKINLPFLNNYKTLRTNLAKNTASLKTYADKVETGGTVVWGEISAIVNFMVDIPTTTINGIAAQNLGISNAAGMIFGKQKAVINKGAVKDMEQITGAKMYINEVGITATISGLSATVRTSVETAATTPFPLVEAKTGVDNYEGGFAGGDAVANDTYALAIDFWLRTNSPNSYVVLEGSPIIEQIEQTDADGNVIVDENEEPILIDAVTGYEGVNRVWNDGTLSEFSTTQGNGSCYIFYSDDPATQQKTLDLVSAMKVAFIDEQGTAIAHAYMDTAHAYQETGKVTVPLVLDGRSVPIVDRNGNPVVDDNGNSAYAVTLMEQNVAQRITAIFYIDGTQLFNENVLADGKIQGQLNLQFGMNEQMEPAKDDDLKYDEVSISAEISDNEFDYDTETNLSTQVTLTVNGLEPEGVKANFIRKINDMQGSREPQITFTKTGEENKWTATMTFDSPGNYVLREVMLDGVSYELESPISATVTGNGIKSLSCDKIFNGNSHTIMTADNSVEASYDLVMASTTNKAKDIQGVIFDDTGKEIITDFIYQAGSYTAKVTFNSSGTYTMQYLIIDGEWYEISPDIQKKLELYLGIKAEVKLSANEFLLEGPQAVNVYAEVYNDIGEEITGDIIAGEIGTDATVEIRYYHGSASNVVLDTDLTWNSSRGRYEGEMLITVAGRYNFGVLKLGTNNITNASSPSITVVSPEPPEYRGASVDVYQFKPDMDAYVTADIHESSAATVTATITNLSTGREYIVDGIAVSTVNEVTKWKFMIPKLSIDGSVTDSGSQDGNWQLTSLNLAGVYVDNTYYDTSNPLVWTLANMESGNLETKVVGVIHVTVKEKAQGATSYSGLIGVDHIVDDLQITISDFAGAPIDGISDVKLRYQLTSRDSSVFSTNSQIPHENIQIVDASLVSDSSIIYQADNVTLTYPGRYSTGVQFTLSGNTYIAGVVGEDETANFTITALPTYTVSWTQPAAAPTETEPAIGSTFSGNSSLSSWSPVNDLSNSIDTATNTVTVYYQARQGLCNSYTYTAPKVTITVDNTTVGTNFTSAYIAMAGDTDTFNFTTSSFASKVEVGKGSSSHNRITLNETITTINIVDKRGVEFAATLVKPIIINLPY